MSENILLNPSFESGWLTDERTGNQQPAGWLLSWRMPGEPMLSAGAFPGEPDPLDKVLTEPECVHKLAIQLPPDEQLGGEDALILDGIITYKVFGVGFSATLKQTASNLRPGAVATFRVPVQVHHHNDGSWGACAFRICVNDSCSQWATFTDGLEDREWAYITASVTLPSAECVVRMDFEGRAIVPVSFFVDALSLVVDGTLPEPVECPGQPREDYARAYNVYPTWATEARRLEIARVAALRQQTCGPSYDDAGIGNLSRREAILWDIPATRYAEFEEWFALYYPGVDVFFEGSGEEPEPPIEPPPTLDTTPFVPNGIKVGWHTIGGQGQEPLFETLAAQGAAPPTAKFVVDVAPAAIVKQYAPNTKIVGRKIDVVYNGKTYKVEGFSYSDDPIVQANARMELLRETMLANPAVDYWEIVNEQQPPFPEATELISLFFVRAMQIAEGWGKKLALFSFSVGEPKGTVDEIIGAWQSAAQTGIFEAAAKGGHAISLHEYGICPLDIPWQLLRFKFLYDNVILPRGLRIPLYVTEYGVPEHLWSVTDKVAQFKAYDNELSKIWYVAGAHIYVNPWDPPYDQYIQYYARYSEYAIAVKGRVNG